MLEFYAITLKNPESIPVAKLASDLYAHHEIRKSEPEKLFVLSAGSVFEVSTSEKVVSGFYVRYDPKTISIYPSCFICDFRAGDTHFLGLLCPREEVVELLNTYLSKWLPVWIPKISIDTIASSPKIGATVTSIDTSLEYEIESMLITAKDLLATKFYQEFLPNRAKGFSGVHLRVTRESTVYPITLFENGKLVLYPELTEDQPPTKGFFEDFCYLMTVLQQVFSP